MSLGLGGMMNAFLSLVVMVVMLDGMSLSEASTLELQGKYAAAIAMAENDLRADPDNARLHAFLGTLYLRNGNFEEGWREYEWRWKSPNFQRRLVWERPWSGEDASGKTLLVNCEQGHGDVFQFCRFLPLVRERCGELWVGAAPILHHLLEDKADRLFGAAKETPDSFDAQTTLLSLPLCLGMYHPSEAPKPPYLQANSLEAEAWKKRLSSVPGFRVGVAWQGNPKTEGDDRRSIPLKCFEPLFGISGASFVSLQKRHGMDQLKPYTNRVYDTDRILDNGPNAFADTAAVLSQVDLLITSDSAIAHLAGALGVRVWVALPFVAEWRWLTGRADSPWYPTMRLFRQKTAGDWGEVFERIAVELRAIA